MPVWVQWAVPGPVREAGRGSNPIESYRVARILLGDPKQ